ncbi:TRAP transporter large permease [Actibacterium sp.]|uniref:TRAP transporter large permease n=1 Tax=Actibacterium sp. TaxID=1872125 RepID=UPI0035636038
MDSFTIGLLCLVGILGLIAIRVPIAMALFGVSVVGLYAVAGERVVLSMLASVPYSTTASWTLSSVPMFLLMGFIAYHSGLTRGLFDGAKVWLGALPGGLVIASLAGASAFAAVTGSSVACSAAIGRIAIPEMKRHNYDLSFSAGSVAAGGTIGALIPPSILLIIFGIQSQQSISDLFLGGLIVGLISLGFYVGATLIVYARSPSKLPRSDNSTWREKFASTLGVWPVLVMILIVFGGLFTGLFTATEAGAVGAFIAIVIGVIRRTLKWQGFKDSVIDTLLSCGSLFIIAIGANLFTRLVAFTGLSNEIGKFVATLGLSATGLLIIIALIYLLLGMFLEPIGAMLLTLPLFLPLVGAHDVNLIWFGILVAKLLEIGMITPPVGLNVFVIHSVARDFVSLENIFKGILPFLAADIVLVALMIATRGFF